MMHRRGTEGTIPNRKTSLAKAFAGLCFCLIVGGCSSSPPVTFDLTAPKTSQARASLRSQLVISVPLAGQPFDGDRIIVRTGADTLALLSGAQWADRLPVLLQSRLVQGFENAHMLRSVGRAGDGVAADYSLHSEIRRFDLDVTAHEAVVELSVKIIRERTGQISAARIFSARSPAGSTDPASASAALDAAASDVMAQIVKATAASRL